MTRNGSADGVRRLWARACVFGAMWISATAGAGLHYVDPAAVGDPTQPYGSQSNPYLTLEEALAAAGATPVSDTIYLATGTYTSPTTGWIVPDAVTIRGGYLSFGGIFGPVRSVNATAAVGPGACPGAISSRSTLVGTAVRPDGTRSSIMRITGSPASPHVVWLEGLNFEQAAATDNGGGGLSIEHASVRIASCGFTGLSTMYVTDEGGGGGGAIYAGEGAVLTVDCASFTANTSAGRGGAIVLRTLEDVSITRSVFSGNHAATEGGAIDGLLSGDNSRPASAVVADSAFAGNSAGVFGGAISNDFIAQTNVGGRARVHRSSFVGNSAGTAGGALLLGPWDSETPDAEAEVLIANCLIVRNTAEAGGGIATAGMGPWLELGLIRVVHCTIADNEATVEGGGIYRESSYPLQVYNSIVWDNAAPSGAEMFNDSTRSGAFSDHNVIKNGLSGLPLFDDEGDLEIRTPSFRDPTGGDYRLVACDNPIQISYAADFADPFYTTQLGIPWRFTDILSRDRVVACRSGSDIPDAGAYEEQADVTPTSWPFAGPIITQRPFVFDGLRGVRPSLFGDAFGTSVAVDNRPIDGALWYAVGVPGADTDAGADTGTVFVYRQDLADVSLPPFLVAELTASDAQVGEKFGASVSMSGGVVLVGAPEYDRGQQTNVGRAFLLGVVDAADFHIWQTAILPPPTVNNGARFATSVAIDDGIWVVGAPNANNGATGQQGRLFVGRVENRQVTQNVALNFGEALFDRVGSSVALDAESGLIVASAAGRVGDERVYWTTVDRALGLSTDEMIDWFSVVDAANDVFGGAVAVSGRRIVVGDPTYASSSGAVAIGTLDVASGAFTLQGVARAPTPETLARFGESVALRSNTLIVGEPQRREGPFVRGAAYVGTLGIGLDLGDIWNSPVAPAGGTNNSRIGAAVAIAGPFVVDQAPVAQMLALVGAPNERDASDTPAGVAFAGFTDAPQASPCHAIDLALPIGVLNIFDILAYFGLFGSGAIIADLTGDGSLNIFDIIEYFTLFGAGCT